MGISCGPGITLGPVHESRLVFSNRLTAVASVSKLRSLARGTGFADVSCTNCSPIVVDSYGLISPPTIGWDLSNSSSLNPSGNRG